VNHVDPDGLFFGKLFGWIGKAVKFAFKVIAVALAIVAMVLLPAMIATGGFWLANGAWFGWGAWSAAVGVAGLAGIAGWHNGRLGDIAGSILNALDLFMEGGDFRTPGINGNANFAPPPPQRGGGNRRSYNSRRRNQPRFQPWRTYQRRGVREPRVPTASEYSLSFPNLRDHASRHGGGMSREEYFRAARGHVESWVPGGLTERVLAYHQGQWKWYYVTRVGPDNFVFTSTTFNNKVILTHMRDQSVGGSDVITRQYLINKGIKLPAGF
jgi:hypothetical protein